MRLPTVELLQSLPLAYYATVEAALCVFRPDFSSVNVTQREERREEVEEISEKDYLDSTSFVPLRLFSPSSLFCLSFSVLCRVSTTPL